MTPKEFYEWAKKEGLENTEVRIQYRDEGGYYYGNQPLGEDYLEVRTDKNFSDKPFILI